MNLVRSRWCRAQRGTQLLRKAAVNESPSPAPSPDRVALVAAMQTLPAAQREAIALHHLADLPVDEVARQLGVPSGTVKARLSRGRAALAAALDDDASSAQEATTATPTWGWVRPAGDRARLVASRLCCASLSLPPESRDCCGAEPNDRGGMLAICWQVPTLRAAPSAYHGT